MNCPKCKSEAKCKNGFKGEKQRYLCKNCGCSYMRSYSCGYHPKVRKKAIALYLEGVGFRGVGRILAIKKSPSALKTHKMLYYNSRKNYRLFFAHNF